MIRAPVMTPSPSEKPDKSNKTALGNLNALAISAAENYNIRTVLLTTTSPSDAVAFQREYRIAPEIFHADAVPLKSMVRSNPGLLLLKNGTVINKWHFRTAPTFEELERNYFQNPQ
jgi:hypothetical protein